MENLQGGGTSKCFTDTAGITGGVIANFGGSWCLASYYAYIAVACYIKEG